MRLTALQALGSSSPHLLQQLSQSKTHQSSHSNPVSATFLRDNFKLSRRSLTLHSPSSLLLCLFGTQFVAPLDLSQARADDGPPAEGSPKSNNCGNKSTTKRAFFDVSIDGAPVGQIIVGLDEANAPLGAARFVKLLSGAAGLSYRRKEFVKIMPSYIQHGGVRSYGVDAEIAKQTGTNLASDTLVSEWERNSESCAGVKNVAGSLGLIVRDPLKPPPKQKLVARQGKLEIDQEQVGAEPNGTEFVISTKDSPELDSSALVIGRVLEGMEVVKRIHEVSTVKENTSSPYFRIAKLVGDKRAVVAERGFNRPYSKIIITNCGLID